MKTIEVKEFKLIQADDRFDATIPNWSRRYEWNYAIEELLKAGAGLNWGSPSSLAAEVIHNTCCGESAIHEMFVDKLHSKFFPDCLIVNSDIKESPLNKTFSGFCRADITNYLLYADYTLCISTIEDFQNFDLVKKAIRNLIANTQKRLIITADYPQLPEQWILDMLQIDGLRMIKGNNALNGSNSTYPQHEFKEFNIMLLDLIIKNQQTL